MVKFGTFWNDAIIIAVLTSASVVGLATADLATSDQDGTQDPGQMCESSPDCNRVVDPRIEHGQDQKVEPRKIIDPGFEQNPEPDQIRMIDPGIGPAEDAEENRIIDPPEQADPGSG
ncbi:hypothetical protein [Parasphingorhabdus sp.]|uniref:hypothetical protein n=1 Tax=Parasphingorhabdus sp. TaxID=2709688 RepID=UPI003A928502